MLQLPVRLLLPVLTHELYRSLADGRLGYQELPSPLLSLLLDSAFLEYGRYIGGVLLHSHEILFEFEDVFWGLLWLFIELHEIGRGCGR